MAATADERNFQSSYYEKVGFRNVEEKKVPGDFTEGKVTG
jgi:hypothetical protein